jgi:hypothetical protein
MKYAYAYPPLLTGGLAGNLPLSVPDLGLWLKADAGVTLVGGAVDVWADQSGNGRDFTAPAAGNRPAYSGTLNGLPVLTFDGSTDYLAGNAASLNIATSVTGITMIAVAKYATGVMQRSIAISDTSTGARCLIGVSTTQWQVAGRRLTEAATTISGGTVNNNYVIHSGVIRYSVATAGVFINSVSQADAAFSTAGNSAATDSASVYIGLGSNLASFMSGDIAEVIIYQRAISVEERNSVERYLSQKWGITI